MRFDYYSQEQLLQVHEASLDILKKVGITTRSERFRTLLLDHGCREEGNRILFTQDVIDKGMKTVPSVFNLHGRNDLHLLEIGKKKAYCQTLVGAPSVVDLESGVRRDALVQDLADMTRLADALDNVNIISPLFPRDVPQEIILTMETATCLKSTSKPLSICIESSRELKFIKELLVAAAGSEEALRAKPLATLPVSPVSPLEYGFDPAEALLDVVDAGLPLGVEPCPQMGATGPMSKNGLVAMHNAEILAGVIAAQLYKPGSPLTMSCRPTFMDMRTGLGLWAMPEIGMMSAAINQLGRHYGIPVAPGGYTCSSKIADAQSGYEHMYNAMIEALVGSDIIGSAGSLDNALVICYTMLVMDNEISSVIQRTVQEFEVNDDNLAVNVVAEVMAADGNFLGHKHTRKYLRSGEIWMPPLSRRETYEHWAKEGKKVEELAKDKARDLLATHQPAPLGDGVEKEFEKIIAAAKKELM